MKLKCNVCLEVPIVELPGNPDYEDQMITCRSCDKQLAYARIEKRKLIWQPVDYTYNKEFGGIPVKIISF